MAATAEDLRQQNLALLGVPKFPLHEAVKANDLKEVKSLLDANQDMYQKDEADNIPLFYLLQRVPINLRMLQQFMHHQFDVNRSCFNGRRMLDLLINAHHQSQPKGCLPAIRYLFSLKQKPDVNLANKSREGTYTTPLHRAIELGCDPELIKLLIDNGAKINTPTPAGTIPLNLAYEQEPYGKEVALFIKARQEELDKQLIAGVKSGNLEQVTHSLENGANPRTNLKNMPLNVFQLSCIHGTLPIVQAFLAHDPFLIQEKNESTRTSPIAYAKYNFDLNVFKFILGRSLLDPHTKDEIEFPAPKTSHSKAVTFVFSLKTDDLNGEGLLKRCHSEPNLSLGGEARPSPKRKK